MRREKMSKHNDILLASPFPAQRPEITITPIDEPPFEVDWQELPWWFGIPKIGDRTQWAVYDPPDWRLSSYTSMETVRSAKVHNIEGVEIKVVDREYKSEDPGITQMIARLTDKRVECLAISSVYNGVRRLYTLLDEGFDIDWGEGSQRDIRLTGRFIREADDSFRQVTEQLQSGVNVEAIETCLVKIDNHTFDCIRVIDLDPVFSEKSVLMEGFLTRAGRTILCRRYNGRQWAMGTEWQDGSRPDVPWDERYPGHNRIVIDGVTFVHWYDCLSDRACGIDPYGPK
jgi:hypothetical protein